MVNPKISRSINTVSKAPEPKRKYDIDSLLTPERKAELRAEAEDKVRAKEIAAAEAEYLKQHMTEYDRARHPEIVEEMRSITLTMAPHMDDITLDGRFYVRDGTYTVKKSVYDVMKDIIWRGFRHDDEVQGRSAQQRKERNLYLSANGGLTDSTGRPAAKF